MSPKKEGAVDRIPPKLLSCGTCGDFHALITQLCNHLHYHHHQHRAMPRAIISPSVLASDFGQLSAECKRMIKGGAEWLHMGTSTDMWSFRDSPHRHLTLCRRHGRVRNEIQYSYPMSICPNPATSCPISQWVSALSRSFACE